jgi:hypothetical protein
LHALPVNGATSSVPLVNTVTSQLLSSLEASNSTFATDTAFDVTVAVGGQVSPEVTIAVFTAGIIPFMTAAFELWRHIAVGDPFGTGGDAVVFIEEDDNTVSSDDNMYWEKEPWSLLMLYLLLWLWFWELTIFRQK